MKRILILLVLLLCAGPVAAQTFLQQVFSTSGREFFVDVTDDAQVAFTVMWNRQTATLLAVMACEGSTDVFEWAASAPLQDRTLRLDVGVFSGLLCLVRITTDLTAAFAINFQSFAEGDLAKAGASPLRILEADAVAPESAARLRALGEEAAARLRKSVERRAVSPEAR